METFDLKAFNRDLRQQIAEKALETKPTLVIFQVGNNPASNIYVRNKIKACQECNIKVEHIQLVEDTDMDGLLYHIGSANADPQVTGIIVQMPLPKHLDPLEVCKAINPNKDVDGFNPINVGRHALGERRCFIPATVKGISSLLIYLEYEGISNLLGTGANCVIIGRSNIVGKPMAYEMINYFGFTTTICSSHTPKEELIKLVHNADIIICAVGKPNFLNFDYFYNEEVCERERLPIVIDVGINRLENGKVVGDCDYDNIKDSCAYITPVPGGVGPLTISGLLYNVAYYKDYQNRM